MATPAPRAEERRWPVAARPCLAALGSEGVDAPVATLPTAGFVMFATAPASLSRRATLRLGAGSLAATLAARRRQPAAAQTASPAAATGGPATIVLVHGAYAGAWIWRKVIPLLRSAGHAVYATTATGMGDRVHLANPAIDLDVYITDVVNLLKFEDLHDVTLVGHSFGGFIITGVAEQAPERLARLVYLDAVVPKNGESNYAFLGYDDAGLGTEFRQGQAIGKPGFEVVPVDFIKSLTKVPADQTWLLDRLVPEPMATESQPITLGNLAAATLPRAFIFCTEGKGKPADDPFARLAQQVRADPHWAYREVADNHLALINAPQATAEALLALV
jgi:pimeloyl-ACP methyl ester carboxylesterase